MSTITIRTEWIGMYLCPVCGWNGIDQDPRNSTYEICPCCSTEFGLSDYDNTHQELRAEWIRAGAKWWSCHRKPPDDWDAHSQLERLLHP